MTRLTAPERETIITKAADERGWAVYTEIPKHVRRVQKLAGLWGVSAERRASGSVSVTLPEKAVRFAAPRKKRPRA